MGVIHYGGVGTVGVVHYVGVSTVGVVHFAGVSTVSVVHYAGVSTLGVVHYAGVFTHLSSFLSRSYKNVFMIVCPESYSLKVSLLQVYIHMRQKK